MVSPKVHPFHIGQELRGPHLADRRTCPPWQLLPGPGPAAGLVCTQQSKKVFFMLLTCWKGYRHPPLPHLQLCFPASEEQIHEVTPGICLGEGDVKAGVCHRSDPLLVAQTITDPQQMLRVRHKYISGCTWSSRPAILTLFPFLLRSPVGRLA